MKRRRTKRKRKKAAFQMSLGMIVAIVFAVILLSLAISWITGLFDVFIDVTHKTTEIAQQKLLDDLSSTGAKVGIAAPAITTWEKSESGFYAVGIRNDDDVATETFYICVFHENPSERLSKPFDPDHLWFQHSKKLILDGGSKDVVHITIRPTAGSKGGRYLFRVVVSLEDESDDCEGAYDEDNEYLYGSVTFALEIK